MPEDLRDTIEGAYLELSQQTGASVNDLRGAALELADSAAVEFASDTQEVQAVAALGAGLRDGSLAAVQFPEESVPDEHIRIAAAYGGQPGQPDFDHQKLTARANAPQPVAPQPQERHPATLTAAQEAEQHRLVAFADDLAARPSRPAYGAASGPPGPSLAGSPGRAPTSGSSAPGLSERTLQIIEACARLAPELFGSSAQELRLAASPAASDPVMSPRARKAAGLADQTLRLAGQASAPVRDVDEDATDRRQPSRGGTVHPGFLEELRARHPDLFGPSPETSGTTVLRPKSPAQRARERRASRPGHTSEG